jgi:hypothetical protein
VNIARAIDGYLDALANAQLALRSPSILVPFLAFGLVQCAILIPLAFFAATPFGAFMPPVVEALGGEESLHYPTHFVLLPATYRNIYLPLVATVGFALWSLALWSMIGHHEASATIEKRSFRKALPSIVAVGLIFVGVTVLVGRGLGLASAKLPPAIAPRLAMLVVIVVTACAQALLVYAPVVLRMRGGGPLSAIRSSARYAHRNFLATALLIGTVLLVHLPIDAMIANADVIAARFRPEVVFQLMMGSVVLEVITALFLFAGVAALALPQEGGLR